MTIIGYARVSTTNQDNGLETQKAKLEAAGSEKLYFEKVTGTSTMQRTELANTIKSANKGDTIVVTKIDRLARSIFDLNKIVGELLEQGVTVQFLHENMEFKPNHDNEPNRQNSMQSLMFNILGSFAQFERDLIVERTTGGECELSHKGNIWEGKQVTLLKP